MQVGDSVVQRNAEVLITEILSSALGTSLEKRRFPQPDGGWLEVDAVSDDPPILCEIWAHQGVPKSAQKAKVMSDAMKLLYVRSLLPEEQHPKCRMLLVLSDTLAAGHFQGRSWMARALSSQGIELLVVELPEEVREDIRKAQILQYR